MPMLIGVLRALGRASVTNPPLICRIFPEPSIPEATSPAKKDNTPKPRSFNTFRNIIPHSISHSFAQGSDFMSASLRSRGLDEPDSFANVFANLPVTNQAQQQVKVYDLHEFFFTKYGSSFSSVEVDIFLKETNNLHFSIVHLQSVFEAAKCVLNRDLLVSLDAISSEIFSKGELKQFPYKSFTETLTLVMLTLLKDLLQQQDDLPVSFTKDVQEFARSLFQQGQMDLYSYHGNEDSAGNGSGNRHAVHTFSLNIKSVATCVELMVWAVRDEHGK